MNRKIFAAILAGGVGTRMGNQNKPKQYYILGDKPILAHTLDKFALFDQFEKLIVLVPAIWKNQTYDIVEKYCPAISSRVKVIEGGLTRNDTIINACNYIFESYGETKDSIIVTHDAVRPFVSYRIIAENIACAITSGACDTVIPASDTIVESTCGKSITDIPLRDNLYQGQTPQSFNLATLYETLTSLTEAEQSLCSDACKALLLRDKEVALVEGDPTNIKITYPSDMLLAQALIKDTSSKLQESSL